MIKISPFLFGYSNYFNFLNNLLCKNLLPKSVIINGDEGIGKTTFLCKFLIDYELSENKLINDPNFDYYDKLFNNKYPNIKVVRAIDNSISINAIRELNTYCYQKSLNGKKKFILINNIENLTIAAMNSLLKLLENPPEDTYLFLLKNSECDVNQTVLSRCFKLNIKFTNNTKKEIFVNLLNFYKISDFKNLNVLNDSDSPGLKIRKILYLKENKIENYDLIKIIVFCLNDYKTNKNFLTLKLAGSFAKHYFYLNYRDNYISSYKIFSCFKKSLENSILFSTDISYLITKIRI